MAITTRRPDLFVAAASFSGSSVSPIQAAREATVEVPQVLLVDTAPDRLFRRFGDPYTNPSRGRRATPPTWPATCVG